MSRGSTGTMALEAMKDDPELVALILGVSRRYPQEASALVQDAIVKSLSTSAKENGPTMTAPSTCPLCSSVAIVQAREDAWHVTCPHCLRFTLDVYLHDLFEAARLRSDSRVLRLLPRLSDAARQTAGEGGRLNLIAENWQAVASRVTANDARG